MPPNKRNNRLVIPHKVPRNDDEVRQNWESVERWGNTQVVNQILAGSHVTLSSIPLALGAGAQGTGVVTVGSTSAGLKLQYNNTGLSSNAPIPTSFQNLYGTLPAGGTSTIVFIWFMLELNNSSGSTTAGVIATIGATNPSATLATLNQNVGPAANECITVIALAPAITSTTLDFYLQATVGGIISPTTDSQIGALYFT